MYIKNWRDLENAYKTLNFFIKMYEECPQLKNAIIDYKKAIREYNSRQQDRYEMDSRSPYDCTGQVFTVWHSIFKRNNGYIVYHHEAMDI